MLAMLTCYQACGGNVVMCGTSDCLFVWFVYVVNIVTLTELFVQTVVFDAMISATAGLLREKVWDVFNLATQH